MFKDKFTSVQNKMYGDVRRTKGIEMSEVLSNCANTIYEKKSGRGLFLCFQLQ